MDRKDFKKKVRRFDAVLIQIIFNVFVSILTTMSILHCAGIIP